ncbi:MAG: phage tail assembly chaperone [Gammaproteobacteria bacterium]|nr:phage tail assembly chaperone [Gammaproteobacteria bacterium]
MHDGEYVLPGVMLDQRTQKWDVAKGVAVDLPGPSAAELTAAAWVALRAERDRRLAACDWTQIPDNPDPKKAQWAAYRQALRDLPKNTTNPANPVWPNLPA